MVELERVLKSKFGFTDERWDEARSLLERVSPERPRAPDEPEGVTGDTADDRIVACAVAAAADVLMSGERRHLLPLGTHRGVQIVTPQALLAQLA